MPVTLMPTTVATFPTMIDDWRAGTVILVIGIVK